MALQKVLIQNASYGVIHMYNLLNTVEPVSSDTPRNQRNVADCT
jgi:hypothetical protein